MAVSAPSISIGADWPIGVAIQSGLLAAGTTPVTPTVWVPQRNNTLEYTTSAHMIKAAYGTRADEQESAQGETRLQGGFETDLRTASMRSLLEAFFGNPGTPTAGYETIAVSQPKYLSVWDMYSGEQHAYINCMLNQLVLSAANHQEWAMRWTVLGGQESLETSATPTVDASDYVLAWSDVTGFTGFGDVVPCQLSDVEITFDNAIQLWYGAGSRAACAATGGEFTIRGRVMLRYDDANAAAVDAAYKSGEDLGPCTLTMGPTGNVHTLYFPNITLLSCTKRATLGEIEALTVNFGVKSAQNFTYTLPAAA